jgi:hypothetical protein
MTMILEKALKEAVERQKLAEDAARECPRSHKGLC